MLFSEPSNIEAVTPKTETTAFAQVVRLFSITSVSQTKASVDPLSAAKIRTSRKNSGMAALSHRHYDRHTRTSHCRRIAQSCTYARRSILLGWRPPSVPLETPRLSLPRSMDRRALLDIGPSLMPIRAAGCTSTARHVRLCWHRQPKSRQYGPGTVPAQP